MYLARRIAIPVAQLICFGIILCSPAIATPKQVGDTLVSTASTASVFVLGGIHQAHEEAKLYTYERMGQVYRHLSPDILAVECLQENIENHTFTGMPFDFKRTMLPLALEDGIPIYGIDWWDETRGSEWLTLQSEFHVDSVMQCDIALLGGMFQLLNSYFCEKDFRDINAEEITAIWSAMNELKYAVLRRSPKYQDIAIFEEERNNHIVNNIMSILAQHPDKRILVAVGIDHKYYIENTLREKGIHVLSVEEVLQDWWN